MSVSSESKANNEVLNMTAKFSRIEAENAPLARSSHSISVFKEDGKELLILLGGEHEARIPIDSTIHLLDLKNPERWERVDIPNGPSPRIAHAQAVLGGSLFVFGGRQGIEMQEGALGDLWELKIQEKRWQPVSTCAGPSKRSFHRMVAVDGKLYVFGGCGETGRLADLWEFDGKKWQELASGPMAGRGGATFFALQGRLFVVGGFAGCERSDVWAYSIAEGTWSQLYDDKDEAFRARSVTAYGQVSSNAVAIFGGEVDPSEKGHSGAGGFANDLVVLRTGEDGEVAIQSIESQDSSPTQRGWGAACGTGDKLVIFGGLTGDDDAPQRLDDLWLIELN